MTFHITQVTHLPEQDRESQSIPRKRNIVLKIEKEEENVSLIIYANRGFSMI